MPLHTEGPTNRWDVSRTEAQAIQERLRKQVRIAPLDLRAVHTVAGADVSFERDSSTAYAGWVALSLPDLQVVGRAGRRTVSTFPYIPGLLSFREAPPLLEAWTQLNPKPDAIVCDGHGLAHPRRFGLACHMGLLLDLPTVGCAKSILCGEAAPVGEGPDDWSPLVDAGEVVGAALLLKDGAAPVYVSVGHRCDLPSAIALVRLCAGPMHIPETTRQAHNYVNGLRRNAGAVEAA